MILLCCATKTELQGFYFDTLLETKGDVEIGIKNGQIVGLAILGIGKVEATFNLQRILSDFQPRYVLFVGLAGAITSGLSGYFVPEVIYQYDLDLTPLGESRGNSIKSSFDYSFLKGLPINKANFATGDRFLTKDNNSDVINYLTYNQVSIVDMESYVVQYVCKNYDIPCLIIRYVSDCISEDNNQDSYNKHTKDSPFILLIDDLLGRLPTTLSFLV